MGQLLTGRTTLAAVVLLLAPLGACGEDTDGQARAVDGPTTLQSDAAPPTPEGFERVSCEVATDDRSLTVVLDVPAGAEAPADDGTPGHSCRFYPQADGVPEIAVVLLHGDPEENDEADIATLSDMEAGFDELYGEEAVENVRWEQDVVVFGETVGNRLTWTGQYEGIPQWDFRAEADGVQVWVTAQGEEFDGAELEETFEQVIASVREG